MHMIGHHHPQRNFGVRIMRRHIAQLFIRTPPNFCQAHFAIHDFSEKMRHIFGAYRHKIRAAIIIMPHGTRRWHAVFIAKQIIWHRYNYLLHKYNKTRTDVARNVSINPPSLYRRCVQRLPKSTKNSAFFRAEFYISFYK